MRELTNGKTNFKKAKSMTIPAKGPIFRFGSLENCNIQEAVLRNASFEGVALHGADLSKSDLSGSEFYLVLAFGASFAGAVLANVKFIGGSYRDADFSGADLNGAIFCGDNMGGAVDLSGANFSGAKIDGAVFQSLIYDDETKFPIGLALNNGAKNEASY